MYAVILYLKSSCQRNISEGELGKPVRVYFKNSFSFLIIIGLVYSMLSHSLLNDILNRLDIMRHLLFTKVNILQHRYNHLNGESLPALKISIQNPDFLSGFEDQAMMPIR